MPNTSGVSSPAVTPWSWTVSVCSGCWQMALFTESDCTTLEVELGYSGDIDAALPEQTETVQLEAVEAGEETPLVFGNDDYEYGWVNQVTCLDSTG